MVNGGWMVLSGVMRALGWMEVVVRGEAEWLARLPGEMVRW